MPAVGRRRSDASPAKGREAPPLDRIDWPVALSVLSYGVRIGVRVNDPRIAEELADHLPPGWMSLEFSDVGRVYSLLVDEDDASAPRCTVYVNDAVLTRGVTVQIGLRAFEADVQLHVAEMAPERVFVHAGVVGYRGLAILLPGRSFSGKTTLVVELVRAGAEYYSDEYAVLDSAGAVHPYARQLSVRQVGGPGVTKCSVDALGGRAGNTPLPVGLVLVSQFRPEGEWQPYRLSPGRGEQALLANTVPARRIPETVLATLHRVVVAAPVVASERGDASSVVDRILELAAGGAESMGYAVDSGPMG
jgi:hypothetical protein